MSDSAKPVLWVVIIAVGVFAGSFAYEKFTQYRLEKALQQGVAEFSRTIEKINKDEQAARQQRELARQTREREKQRQAAAEVYRDTACAINTDTQTCSCISMKTGARVQIQQADCAKRANEITR